MIRIAAAMLMAGTPAVAQDILPPHLICTLTEICDPDRGCTVMEDPLPTFSMERIGRQWLWDPSAEWNGFPVLVATTLDNARTAHVAGYGDFGLALVIDGSAPEGPIVLNGHRLIRFPDRTVSDTRMQHHCHPVVAAAS